MADQSPAADDTVDHPVISVIIPANNEEPGIAAALGVINGVLASCEVSNEIIVIDDGSTDGTYAVLNKLCQDQENLRAIKLSRNFGKESAMLAGLRAATGDAVITIDADLQHPPELIPEMIERWKDGAMVVHAVKRQRAANTAMERVRASIYNNLLKFLGGIDLRNSSDYKLIDRVVVNALVNELHEYQRFFRGLVTWVGYRQEKLFFDVAERQAGETKWSTRSLIGLAITGIVSFTSMPLRIVTIFGILTLLLAFGVAVEALWSWFIGTAVTGFMTIIFVLLLLGSFIMISLGIMGEYIAKIYEEVKNRPDYLVDRSAGFNENEHQ